MQRKSKDWHKRELKVEIRQSPAQGYQVVLTGAITEDAIAVLDGILLQVGGASQAPIAFELSGIEFLNSIGIQQWMKFLASLGRREMFFDAVSSAMCEHVTLISGFTGGARIRSFHLPYFCPKCRKSTAMRIEADATASDAPPPAPQCECGREMSLDMMDEDFVLFMESVKNPA